MDAVGRDLFTQDLQETLTQFEQADNFGSLIQPKVKDAAFIRQRIEEQGVFEDLFLHQTNLKALKVLEQAEYLSPGYQVVVANPPYMSGRSMNARLKSFASSQYPTSKSDLFAMFIEISLELAIDSALVGMITMQSWMFLKSFADLRGELLQNYRLVTMAHLGERAFDTIGGAIVSTTSFVIEKANDNGRKGYFIRLIEGRSEEEKKSELLLSRRRLNGDLPANCFTAGHSDFIRMPGSPIAYWASGNTLRAFETFARFGDYVKPAVGLNTGDNKRFLRYWSEIAYAEIKMGCLSIDDARNDQHKWFPYNKGGSFRKWYGNQFHVINWEDDGRDVKRYAVLRNRGKHWSRYIQNLDWMFRQGVTWSTTSSSNFGCRYTAEGFLFDVKGTSAFSDDLHTYVVVGFLTTRLVNSFLRILNPTIEYQSRDIKNLPFMINAIDLQSAYRIAERCIEYAKEDWNAFETSWEFGNQPLIQMKIGVQSLYEAFLQLRAQWHNNAADMQNMEEANNNMYLHASGLAGEISSKVPISEITLTCNPHYRYPDTRKTKYTDEERETLLLADTMKEFISYAVGCMFGRYSLDKPGLILADQGETAEDYRGQVPDPTFSPDEDNVIPILDEGWFEDDIAERFKQFLQVSFGTENYEENLVFLEDAIGKDIRSYFLKSFYKEHVKMYKRRPIYWLFSSPSGSFNALIYMHRYRPDTISIILNDYLRQYYEKLRTHQEQLEQVSVSASASRGDKTKALKEIDKVSKVLTELKIYEDKILYPLATKQVEIDLDDGVMGNYNKFGKALKRVSGLSQ